MKWECVNKSGVEKIFWLIISKNIIIRIVGFNVNIYSYLFVICWGWYEVLKCLVVVVVYLFGYVC